jgi:hypothetical protein
LAARRVIAGGVTTHGSGIEALEMHGKVEMLSIADGFSIEGGGFEAFAR